MPNTGFPRAKRLAEQIKRLLGEWLEHQPEDRKLGFVTVTDVRVTGDLREAKVYFSVLQRPGEDEAVKAATIEKLQAVKGEGRTWIAQRVRLRYTPTLEFIEDDLPVSSARIDQLLASLPELTEPRADEPEPEQAPDLPTGTREARG
jgi:ribosome-binding factor A